MLLNLAFVRANIAIDPCGHQNLVPRPSRFFNVTRRLKNLNFEAPKCDRDHSWPH